MTVDFSRQSYERAPTNKYAQSMHRMSFTQCFLSLTSRQTQYQHSIMSSEHGEGAHVGDSFCPECYGLVRSDGLFPTADRPSATCTCHASCYVQAVQRHVGGGAASPEVCQQGGETCRAIPPSQLCVNRPPSAGALKD